MTKADNLESVVQRDAYDELTDVDRSILKAATLLDLDYDTTRELLATKESSDTLIVQRDRPEGVIAGYDESPPSIQKVENGAILEAECDLLVPASIGGRINAKNAGKIQCKAILELANMPTTSDAAKILHHRRIPVVPDVIANSGGVYVSGLEISQNLQQRTWSKEEVTMELEKGIKHAMREIVQIMEAYRRDPAISDNIGLRTAAYILGVNRLAKAIGFRGGVF